MGKPPFKDFLRDSQTRRLAMEVRNKLAVWDDQFQKYGRYEKALTTVREMYAAALDDVIREGKDLAARLAAHEKALAEIQNFLECISAEGNDYDLSSPSGFSGDQVGKTTAWWDKTVVPNIKSHGVVPAVAVGASKMHALLVKLGQVEKKRQAVLVAVMGATSQRNQQELSLGKAADKLRDKLKAQKDDARRPDALEVVGILDDIERRVHRLEL